MEKTACKKVGILTSGGDAPGMNAAVRAATLLLHAAGCEVVGIRRGYQGVLDGDFAPLLPEQVAGIIREGGTILGSARCLAFMERDGRDRGRRQLREAGIDGLIAIGGNGTLTGAAALTDPEELGDQRLSVVGLPASIDNDIGLTGMAIGVDTAMNTIVDACDKISDTASAHDRTFLVEVMGRDCGYLAMTSSVAAAADAVLFPEAGKSTDDLVDTVVKAIAKARQRGPSRTRRVLVIVAEGAGVSLQEMKDRIGAKLEQRSGKDTSMEVETRVTVLGHVVRGGRPSAFDRLLANRLAHVAVRALLSGQTRKMAAWMLPVELPANVAERSAADPYCFLVDLGAVLTETRRLLEGTSPLVQWRRKVFEEVEDVLAT